MPPASLNLGKSTTASSTRNTALLTITGVVLGGYALFRAQGPAKGQGLVKEDDNANVTGDTKLGRGMVLSKDDAKNAMGDPPHGHGHVGRGPR